MSEERTYKEVEMPVGTFRMYDDNPGYWVQVTGKPVVQRIMEAFDAGEIRKDNK